MNVNEKFLEALKASLKSENVSWPELMIDEWNELFRLASQQQVLPLIYEAVYKSLDSKIGEKISQFYGRKVFEQVAIQTMKTKAFLELYQKLRNAGTRPLVIKGLVCRNLYPQPDCRPSSDEDILIKDEQLEIVHQVMLDENLELMETDGDIYVEHEVPYIKKDNHLFVEVHKYPFPRHSEAYSDYSRFFEGVHERAREEIIFGVSIYTMEYTDHLLYLMCHALKHFLHSGVGVRQVCDMVLFANAYGKDIDWKRIIKCCKEIYAEQFMVAVFRIGQNFLGFDVEKSCFPKEWIDMDVDEKMLLSDMLAGGVLGNVGVHRIHSSNITLNAVCAQKKIQKRNKIFLKTIFPSIKMMIVKYKYLKKYPILLPVAWGSRIVKYGLELIKCQNGSPIESIEIGKQRIQLLKAYGILK